MREIFASASRVIMWLGTTTHNSTVALQTLERIGKQLEYTNTGTYLPSPECEEKERWHAKCRINLPSETWRSIADLVQMPYFERLWVMQEIQLANHHSIVKCGEYEMKWYYLCRALLKCKYDTPGLPEFASPLLQTKMEHVYHLSNDLRALDCDHLFYMASRCICADERDKIFAILGLVP